ncbi:MAG: AAA family ATPase [Candidatus Magasanikbacteria bacterium]|nr:AAA family ATPase [Candidatus Magasanikbacteria bacterium]
MFDEIDKAHKDVTKLLLQMLENGEITDSTGKKISLKHSVIILTTTLGADAAKRAAFGFGASDTTDTARDQKIVEKLKEYFSPEIINRLDKICLFNNLTKADLAKIAGLEIEHLNQRLTQYHTQIKFKESTLQEYLCVLPKENQNARTLRRQLRTQIEKLIAGVIMEKKNKKQYQLEINGEQLSVK